MKQNLVFCARVLAAVAIAYYTAYWLELESPASAATTVLIVMNASRGAIISKSLWRLFGSAVGALVAIGLVAVFAQAPVLFVLGLALWIGLCTSVASLLRYNRGYAAVLAGYTVVLVAFGAISDPDRIFDLATGRLAVVTIGELSATLVFMATDPGPGPRALDIRIAGLIAATARVIADALAAPDLMAARQARSGVALAIDASDQVLEFAVVEDAEIGRHARDLRMALAELFAALTGGLRAVEVLRREQPQTAHDLRGLMANLAERLRSEPAAAWLAQTTATRQALAEQAACCRDVAVLAALDQALVLLDQFVAALGGLDALQRRRPRAVDVRLLTYFNPVTALRNGVRAALAISMAGLFWIVSAWPSGAAMLTILGPICALLALTESAAAGSVAFFKGTLIALAAAFLVTYGILPQTAGFPLLMISLTPFLAAGVIATRIPRFAPLATPFLIFFNTAVGATNPMRFDLAATLNSDLALLLGAGCAVLAFRVLLPPNPFNEARVLFYSIRNDVQRLARTRFMPPRLVFEHLQHQKLVRMSRRLASRPVVRAVATSNGATAVMIGRLLARLKRAAVDATLPAVARAAAARSVAACRRLLISPDEAARIAGAQAGELATGDAPQAVLQIAAILHELAQLISTHAEYLRRAQALLEPA